MEAPLSGLGARIRVAREAAGFRRQPDAAAASAELERQDAERYKRFSQPWLSNLENDRVQPDSVNRGRLRALERLTGLDLGGGEIKLDKVAPRRAGGRTAVDAGEMVSVPLHGPVSGGLLTKAVTSLTLPASFLPGHDPGRLVALDLDAGALGSDEVRPLFTIGVPLVLDPRLAPQAGDVVLLRLTGDGPRALVEYWPGRRNVTLRSWDGRMAPVVLDRFDRAGVEAVVVSWSRVRPPAR